MRLEEAIETALAATAGDAGRRRELVEQLSILNKGINILNEIRDSGITSSPPTANIHVSNSNNSNINMSSSYNFSSSTGTAAISPTHMNHYTSGHVVRAPIAAHYPHQPSTTHSTIQGSSPGNPEPSTYLHNGVGGSAPTRRSLGGDKTLVQNSTIANMNNAINNNNGYIKTALPQLSNSTTSVTTA